MNQKISGHNFEFHFILRFFILTLFCVYIAGIASAQTKQIRYIGFDNGGLPTELVFGYENAESKYQEILKNDQIYYTAGSWQGIIDGYFLSTARKSEKGQKSFLIEDDSDYYLSEELEPLYKDGWMVTGCGTSHDIDREIITIKKDHRGDKYFYSRVDDLEEWLAYYRKNSPPYSPYLLCSLHGSLYVFAIRHTEGEPAIRTAFIWAEAEQDFNKKLVELIDDGYLVTSIDGLNGWFASLVHPENNYSSIEMHLVDRVVGDEDFQLSVGLAKKARLYPAFFAEERIARYFIAVQRPHGNRVVFFW